MYTSSLIPTGRTDTMHTSSWSQRIDILTLLLYIVYLNNTPLILLFM